jgi:hypothetical protein
VLKMHLNPQGPNVLANEALGSILLSGLGFLAPRWRPVTIDLRTVQFFPGLAMETDENETTFPACGTHFGSEYLGGSEYDLYEFMLGVAHTSLEAQCSCFPSIYSMFGRAISMSDNVSIRG